MNVISLHPILPSEVSDAIKTFGVPYFRTQRLGLFRRKLHSDDVMKWQAVGRRVTQFATFVASLIQRLQSVISGPLLSKTKANQIDILRAFKVVQHIMGDRNAPVDGLSIPTASSSAFSLAAMAETSSPAKHKDDIWTKAEHRLLLEEQRWLLQLGVTHVEIRDEIYAMVMKQVTGNPQLRVPL